MTPTLHAEKLPSRAVLLGAGGLASTVLTHWLVAHQVDVGLLSCDFGGQATQGLAFAAATAEELRLEHRVADLTAAAAVISGDAVGVPAGVRNAMAIMLDLGVGWAINRGAPAVMAGLHADDAVARPEGDPAFLAAATEQAVLGNLGLSTDWFSIQAPLAELSVGQVIQLGHELQVTFDRTWSCLRDGPAHCGWCSGCRHRRGAFDAAGITDPTEYGDHPTLEGA